MKQLSVCICGGGNLAHVTGGYLASMQEYDVRLLTRHPERWLPDLTLTVTDCNGKTFHSRFSVITSDPQTAVQGADMILLCLPGFAIASALESIKPFIGPKTLVGSIVSSTGFFLMAKKIVPSQTGLFGFQRVPFIARTQEYGRSANLLGYKPSLAFATMNIENPSNLEAMLSRMFSVPVHWLDSHLKVTLTNSNPLLHPSRLYGMFNKRTEFDSKILFYEDWDNLSSETLIACDNEFGLLLSKLGVSRDDIPSLLTYYESSDADSLTRKIRSIQAFKGLYAPMVELPDGHFKPDFGNRYFSEDIPFGILIIKGYCSKYGIATPTIDKVIYWAQAGMQKDYLNDGVLNGKDLDTTIVPYILNSCNHA